MSIKRSLLLVLLLLAPTACTLGAGTRQGDATVSPTAMQNLPPEPTDQEVESQAIALLSADGEQIEVVPPPPDGITVLLARVAAGDISLPQAAIAGLKVYVGEEPGIDLFADGERLKLAGWRLSALAQEAYALASPEEQVELERVYNKLVPSPQVLEAISAPAEQSGSRPPGLAGPTQQTDCLALWEEGFAPDETTICLLYIEFNEGGHTYRVYYPEARRLDGAFLAYVEAAAEALRESVRVYAEWTELRDINLIFTALTPEDEEAEDTAAFVPDLRASEITSAACPVLVLPGGASGGADDGFKQVIAHEVFHCVEYWRQGRATASDADWYIEGMAEYFGGVVYPNANVEHEYLNGFNYFTATESLLDLQYASWVFFQYLGDRFGKEYVIGMLDVLPTSGGKSAQAAALAGIGDMATVFHEFSQAFLDGQLRDENGSGLPMTPYYLPANAFTLSPAPDRELAATPFQIGRYRLRYEEAKEYLINLEITGDTGMLTARNVGGGVWDSLPLEMRVGCEDVVYIGLVTNTASSGEYRASTHTDWLDEFECDRCLIGTWMQDTPVIESTLRSLAVGANIVSVRGQFFLEIDEGSMKFTPMGYGTKFQNDDEIVDFGIEGTSTSLYVIPAEGQIFAVQETFNFIATVTNSAGTFTVPIGPEAVGMIPSPFSFGPTDPLDAADVPDLAEILADMGSTAAEFLFTYECSDTTLISYPPPGLGAPASSIYMRVSAP